MLRWIKGDALVVGGEAPAFRFTFILGNYLTFWEIHLQKEEDENTDAIRGYSVKTWTLPACFCLEVTE